LAVKDVSIQPLGPIFKGQTFQDPRGWVRFIFPKRR